jgi:hypothetical protein
VPHNVSCHQCSNILQISDEGYTAALAFTCPRCLAKIANPALAIQAKPADIPATATAETDITTSANADSRITAQPQPKQPQWSAKVRSADDDVRQDSKANAYAKPLLLLVPGVVAAIFVGLGIVVPLMLLWANIPDQTAWVVLVVVDALPGALTAIAIFRALRSERYSSGMTIYPAFVAVLVFCLLFFITCGANGLCLGLLMPGGLFPPGH